MCAMKPWAGERRRWLASKDGTGASEMDALRLADVRAGTEARAESCGSGYLIGPRLVLTARHVVTGKGGLWPQVEVRIGHPGFGPSTLVAARACWTPAAGPGDCDVALLELDHAVEVAAEPVRWGRPVG